ncbi:hypothetical protein PHMEG_0004483 [Phytophthora megakarya]|uniref:Transmembrane protein n=1 Tax=Phytophthora megakarya TaxID=4795 RepID=A0A225WVD7_9STRA|nr:hypothetical protein PHMEG_0004483 [Phytophthora megakarya]
MPQVQPSESTELVNLSYKVFVGWWIIIASVHTVTSIYDAFYAYCYWKLQDLSLNKYLEGEHIGMPSPYHLTISIVHLLLAAVHAICILLMIGGSMYQRSLVFTPWSSSQTKTKIVNEETTRIDSIVLKNLLSVYDTIANRWGVYGKPFDAILIPQNCADCAPTYKAYRMSVQLPGVFLNGFYVVLVAVNCWSCCWIHSGWFKRGVARRRFACIVLDCILGLVSCMGVELIVLFSYVGDYDVQTTGFPAYIWYNDEWVARVVNELKVIVVVSWWDLCCRVRTIHYLFGAWGVAVLGLHMFASVQPALPQCLLQVRPWGLSCYLVGLDCHTLDIAGQKDEVVEKWREFEPSTVVELLIRHCPALEIPDLFNEFHELTQIKIYNTTINDWGKSSAITNANHPNVLSLLVVRTNMTNGILPDGMHSDDFPHKLFDFEFCVFENPNLALLGISNTNVRELPRNVTQLSAVLLQVSLIETNISFFCLKLDKIQNGSAIDFDVPLQPDYSQILVNVTKGNMQEIKIAVNCDTNMVGTLYPLTYEDTINAISTPAKHNPLIRTW